MFASRGKTQVQAEIKHFLGLNNLSKGMHEGKAENEAEEEREHEGDCKVRLIGTRAWQHTRAQHRVYSRRPLVGRSSVAAVSSVALKKNII